MELYTRIWQLAAGARARRSRRDILTQETMTDGTKPTYIVYEKGWETTQCPHCDRTATVHGWLYSEKDSDGTPILKVEVWEHDDGSRHQMWKLHGVPTVEFKEPG